MTAALQHARVLADSAAAQQPLNVGLLTVAVGQYAAFITPLLRSMQRFYFTRPAELRSVNVTVFVWTDAVSSVTVRALPARGPAAPRALHVVFVPHTAAVFPAASLRRVHAYLQQRALWQAMDYVHHIDSDAEFAAHVGAELLTDGLFATAHADNFHYSGDEVAGVNERTGELVFSPVRRYGPGLFFHQACLFDNVPRVCVGPAPYDEDRQRVGSARVDSHRALRYYYGGAFGGRRSDFEHLCEQLRVWIDRDMYGLFAVACLLFLTTVVRCAYEQSGGLHAALSRQSYVNSILRTLTGTCLHVSLHVSAFGMGASWLYSSFPVQDWHADSQQLNHVTVYGLRGRTALLPAEKCAALHDLVRGSIPHGWLWPCVAGAGRDCGSRAFGMCTSAVDHRVRHEMTYRLACCFLYLFDVQKERRNTHHCVVTMYQVGLLTFPNSLYVY